MAWTWIIILILMINQSFQMLFSLTRTHPGQRSKKRLVRRKLFRRWLNFSHVSCIWSPKHGTWLCYGPSSCSCKNWYWGGGLCYECNRFWERTQNQPTLTLYQEVWSNYGRDELFPITEKCINKFHLYFSWSENVST